MKITLIMPKAAVEGMPYDIPIGFGYLSSVLKRAGHTVSLLNLNHYDYVSNDELIQRIQSTTPDVIGTGGMSFSFKYLRFLLGVAKGACPDAITMVGGMVVTSQPDVAFAGLGADIGIIGEGEETVVELMQALGGGNIADVKGIIYRDQQSGDIVTTMPRPLIKDLSTLPWPDYEGLEMDKFVNLRGNSDDGGLLFSHHDDPRMVPIMTSRGCPFKCTFCCYELVETQYRTRDLDDVMAEIEHLIDRYQINTLFISDDLFSLKKSRLYEFCERIKPLNLNWQCSLRVKPLERDTLEVMRDAGCKAIGYGVESASPDVLLAMKKKITVADIDRTLEMTHDVGIGIGGNLIFCDPVETQQTVRESLGWFAANPQYIIRMAMVGFHPGTVIYRDAVANGQIKNNMEYLENCEFEINVTDIPDAVYVEIRNHINFLTMTTGVTGKITSLSELGDNRMEMQIVCPNCQASNTYKKVFKRLNAINWISCRSCCSRYKVPLTAVSEITTSHTMTFEHPAMTDPAERLEAYKIIAKKADPHHSVLLALGKLFLDLGDASKFLPLLNGALKLNPCNPEYQHQYAKGLSRAGLEDLAVMHERQAQMLAAAGLEDMIYVTVDQAVREDQATEEGNPLHMESNLAAVEAI